MLPFKDQFFPTCTELDPDVGNRYFENSVATAIAICWK